MLKRLVFATCFFLFAGSLSAQTIGTSYTLVPQTIAADQDFSLALKNPKFSCATVFSGQSVNISGNVLNLSFKAMQDTVRRCSKSDSLFGPVFSIPALTPGSDSVYASQQPACAPLCALPVMREFAGMLTVTKPAKDSGWFIQPRQASVGRPFTLQLLNYAYGNCQTTFTHMELSIENGSLHASFVVENHPERVCIADIRPHGPSYEVPGLKMGAYPVYAVQHLACEYANPRCLIAVRPLLVDTLRVVSFTSLFSGPRTSPRKQVSPDALGVVKGYWVNGRSTLLLQK